MYLRVSWKNEAAFRYLFDNWFSLLIRYALIRLGFNVKLMAKVNGCAFELSPEAFGYLVNRASSGLIKLIRCNDCDVFVIYMNGIRVPIKELEKSDAHDIDIAIKNGWVYDLTNGFWFKNILDLGIFAILFFKSLMRVIMSNWMLRVRLLLMLAPT